MCGPPRNILPHKNGKKKRKKPWRDQELCSLAEGSLVWLSVSSIIISIAYEVKTRSPPPHIPPQKKKKKKGGEREKDAHLSLKVIPNDEL
jgi:hypothetical protein